MLSSDDESDAEDSKFGDSSNSMMVANPLFALLNKPVIHATKTDKSDNEDDEGKGEARKSEDGDNDGKKEEKSSKVDPKEYFERGLLEYNNGENVKKI